MFEPRQTLKVLAASIATHLDVPFSIGPVLDEYTAMTRIGSACLRDWLAEESRHEEGMDQKAATAYLVGDVAGAVLGVLAALR